MKIDVLTYNDRIDRESFRGKTAVVVDVLRCTSVMITALANGAKRIIPVLEPEDAFRIADKLGRVNCVIGGERGCNKVPGFDFGNSPSEYSHDSVGGKTVIISTSNGTAAINAALIAESVLVGAMLNSGAAARTVAALDRDLIILCAGTARRPSADDYCASGSIIKKLLALKPDCECSDIALICVHLYDSLNNGSFDLMQTGHCRRLELIGYGRDLAYCLTDDVLNIVPEYKNGEIVQF